MKKILSILVLACALAASAQITNGVKISGLPAATLPLTGSEVMPLNQSGVTKAATLAQILVMATSQDLATTNGLAALLATETAARSAGDAASLVAIIATNTATLSALAATNAALSARLNTNAAAIAAATAAIIATNAATLSALAATNAAIAVQIAAATAAVSNAMNTGFSTFGTLTTTNLVQPTLQLPLCTMASSYTTNISLTASGMQNFNFYPSVNAGSLYLYPTNFVDGLTVSVLVQNTSSANSVNVNVPTFTASGWRLCTGSKIVTLAAGKSTVITWQVITTNIFSTVGTAF